MAAYGLLWSVSCQLEALGNTLKEVGICAALRCAVLRCADVIRTCCSSVPAHFVHRHNLCDSSSELLLVAIVVSFLQDVVNEAVKWGGKVLLHQEVGLPAGGRSTGMHPYQLAAAWCTSSTNLPTQCKLQHSHCCAHMVAVCVVTL